MLSVTISRVTAASHAALAAPAAVSRRLGRRTRRQHEDRECALCEDEAASVVTDHDTRVGTRTDFGSRASGPCPTRAMLVRFARENSAYCRARRLARLLVFHGRQKVRWR